MPDIERLWIAIPIGEDRAEAAAEIWRRYDLGARETMRLYLSQLATEGLIKRKSSPLSNGRERYVYYRAPDNSVGLKAKGK